MDGEVFRDVLGRQREAVDSCYQSKLVAAPTAAGDLVLVIAISAQGAVTVEVEQNSPALDAAGVTACVVAVLNSMSFADNPPQGGDVRVRVPLSFVVP
jgi:hypothetical protein